MEIIPPQLHMSLQESERAGFPPIRTVGEPGIQGAEVTGIHGIGVSTPRAAAVAEATCGLDKVVHIPNGMIFTIGLLSIIVAQGFEQPIALFSGRTPSCDGAIPKEQLHIAP